ncbi:hypothetical protein BB560_006993 [Smittium megazygosporum]|uniref:Uncharacterized protein n=1 Tax=Smittium megazygosporum TaxID=133381 RepID=A0A2T9XZM3_9FUNG|nr:hypothetical protein BB560_006993 [Smittium megazygosporum]
MVTHSMALKHARYEEEGITEEVIDITLNGEQTRKRHKKYDALQTKFLQWCDKNNIDTQNFPAPEIINVLTWGKLRKGLKNGTIKNYCSWILDFAKNPESIISDPTFKGYFKKIAEIHVKPFDALSFNIQQVVEKLQIEPLTQRLPGDIERIDDARTTVTEDYVKLINLRFRFISNDSESQTAISGLGRRVGQLDAGQTENAEYQGTKPDQSPHPTATRLVLPSSSSKGSLH